MKTMVCLVGEQPIPNLLLIRALRPEHVLMVVSDRTEPIAENLRPLVPECRLETLRVPPYDLNAIIQLLSARTEAGTVFNLTGGTKTMSLAAYQVAQSRSAEILYLESERLKSVLYRYVVDYGLPKLHERTQLRELLTIDDYVAAHGIKIEPDGHKKVDPFEAAVADCLRVDGFEVRQGVKLDQQQTDVILRWENQVGVAEVKSGEAARAVTGVNQVLSRTLQERLGTYTKRFLIVDRPLDENNRAIAHACRINVIVLESYQRGYLSETDAKHLRTEVSRALGRTP